MYVKHIAVTHRQLGFPLGGLSENLIEKQIQKLLPGEVIVLRQNIDRFRYLHVDAMLCNRMGSVPDSATPSRSVADLARGFFIPNPPLTVSTWGNDI